METQLKTNWYIVKTQGNRERSVAEKIRVESEKGELNGKIGEIIIPMETTVNVINRKKVVKERLMIPGYIFVETNSLGELKTFIRRCEGASTLLSDRHGDIQRISKHEIDKMIGISEESTEIAEVSFITGQEINITDGPFKDFKGTISSIEGNRVKVSVMIFGRETLVELETDQINKINE
jgi:transcription termination/antitermination protein NusG